MILFSLMAMLSAGAAGDADEVIVTAQRQPSALADAPLSISLVRAGDAPVLGHHPAELLNQVPGVMVQAGSGQEHLTALRSPALTGGAGAGSFLYLQDGVPLRSAGFANVNGLFDAQTPFMDRAEVVRGPGDVAYGSNALHGSVNILSKDPLSEEQGVLSLSAGAFDRKKATLSLAGQRGQQGFLLGLHAYQDGGYRAASGLEQFKGQMAHGWAGESLTVRTRAHYHKLDQETAGFVQGVDAYKDDDLRRTNPNPEAFRRSDHGLVSSEIALDAGAWQVQAVPYLQWADMQFLMHFLPSRALEDNHHRAIGVLSTASRQKGGTQILFGLDVEAATGAVREEQFIPTVFSYTTGLHYDYEVDASSVAPFVRLRQQLTPALAVQAGARLTHTHYAYDNKTEDGIVGRFLRPADRSDDFSVVTGKVAALYRVGAARAIFASLSRGARPPQTTDLYRLQSNQTVDGIEPETLTMAELGVRDDRGALQWSVIGFMGQKKNFLFRDADGFTVDDGQTTHDGVEWAAQWALSDQLALNGGGTWAQHRYDFTRPVGRATESIVAGNDVDTAPAHVGRFGIRWTPRPSVQGALTAQYVGEYFTDAANTNSYPGHTVVDASLGLDLNPGVRVTAAVKNLADVRYASRADFAFGNERYFPGEERHMVVGLKASW